MRYYIALIHKDADSDFGVSFPDLPGCITAGRTLDEARVMAAEALALHLEGMIADGENVPEPSSIEAIMANPASHDGVVTAVPALPLSEGPAVRVNVMLPETLLAEIDRHAQAHGLTRSAFLADAARRAIVKAA
jgi:predicted RNase H-like HicB family nuclease